MEWVCWIILTITFVHAIITEGWGYAFKLAGETILIMWLLGIILNTINRFLDNSGSDRRD